MSAGMPELGSKISLISKADIRYEGRLFTVDPQECTIALASVRSFGTEDREAECLVAPQNQVYDYILFRGSDIKDIRVVNNIGPLPNDPAIVQLSAPSIGSQPYQQTGYSHPVMGHMGHAMPQYPAYAGQMGPIGGMPSGMAPGMGMYRDPRTMMQKQPSELVNPMQVQGHAANQDQDFMGGSRTATPTVAPPARKSPTMDQSVQATASPPAPREEKKAVAPPAPAPVQRVAQPAPAAAPPRQAHPREPREQYQRESQGQREQFHREPREHIPREQHPREQREQHQREQQHHPREQQHHPREQREYRDPREQHLREHQREQQAMQMHPLQVAGGQRGGGWVNRAGGGVRRGGRGRGGIMPPGAGYGRQPLQPTVGGPGGKPRNTLKFENDYDFEQANTEFEELRTQLAKIKVDGVEISPLLAPEGTTPAAVTAPAEGKTAALNGEAERKDGDSGNETGTTTECCDLEEDHDSAFYDKAKSFFDNISCEAVERSKGRSQRTDWRTERKLNSETFGVASARRGGFRGRGGYYNNRGGGMGGGMYRGAYRGNYNRPQGGGGPRGGQRGGSNGIPPLIQQRPAPQTAEVK